MIMPDAFVFILADKIKELEIMVYEKDNGENASRINYNNRRLVYYEIFNNPIEAASRKETIQSWPERKIRFLIDYVNPSWDDWKEEIEN